MTPELRAALLEGIESDSWPLFLFGGSGRGKSAAAALLYRAWPGKAYWFDFSTLVRALCVKSDGLVRLPVRDGRWMPEPEALGFLRSANMLVLDDVATRGLTEPGLDMALQIVGCRSGKPLAVTCNYGPETLEQILDARLVGRLCSGLMIECAGPNRRIQKARFMRVGGGAEDAA